MAATRPAGTQQVGTDAAPVVIANGANETWTHNFGVRATKVEAINATHRAPVVTGITITQPDVNSINIANASGGEVRLIVRATWEPNSAQEMAPLAQSVFV